MQPTINVFSFAFVDPSMFFSTMTLKYGKHFADEGRPPLLTEPPFQDCQHILLRGPADANWGADGEHVDYPMLAGWPSAQKLIADISAKTTEHLGAPNLTFGKVYVESLRSGGCVGWHVDDSPYAKAHTRMRLLVSPCAGGAWFSGGDSLPPGVGNLTLVNHQTLHSAINLGPVPQISVVADVRRPTLQ